MYVFQQCVGRYESIVGYETSYETKQFIVKVKTGFVIVGDQSFNFNNMFTQALLRHHRVRVCFPEPGSFKENVHNLSNIARNRLRATLTR